MRLKRVAVKGLFGLFNHDIRFSDGENVAIIYGPNGFGKTVMLRMIAALVSGESTIFHQIPFSEFWLDFDDGSRRAAIRKVESSSERAKPLITFRQIASDGTSKELTPAHKELLDIVDKFVPGMPRYQDGWRDEQGRIWSVAEVLHRYPQIRERLSPKVLGKIDSLAIEDFKVFFVETNRLFASRYMSGSNKSGRSQTIFWRESNYNTYTEAYDEPKEPRLRVVQYSVDLIRRIQIILADYAKHSQESDRTFPEVPSRGW